MDPRLKSSTKWSPFPGELIEQITQTMEERFSEEYGLEDMDFIVEGRIYPEEILLRIGLAIQNQLKQHNFEFSFEYDNEKEQTLDRIQGSMDVVEHIWTEFLEEDMEDGEMPRQWQSMPFQKLQYFFKYSTVNTNLEAQADKLLEELEDGLWNEDKDSPEFEMAEQEETTIH